MEETLLKYNDVGLATDTHTKGYDEFVDVTNSKKEGEIPLL